MDCLVRSVIQRLRGSGFNAARFVKILNMPVPEGTNLSLSLDSFAFKV